MVTVYGMRESGNCYKVALVLEQLGQAYRWCETDIMQGASRSAEFLARNLNGRVPVLEIAPGDWLAESNAILCYLAEQTPLLPLDRRQRAARAVGRVPEAHTSPCIDSGDPGYCAASLRWYVPTPSSNGCAPVISTSGMPTLGGPDGSCWWPRP